MEDWVIPEVDAVSLYLEGVDQTKKKSDESKG